VSQMHQSRPSPASNNNPALCFIPITIETIRCFSLPPRPAHCHGSNASRYFITDQLPCCACIFRQLPRESEPDKHQLLSAEAQACQVRQASIRLVSKKRPGKTERMQAKHMNITKTKRATVDAIAGVGSLGVYT
jgi:hypothetical protein